MLKLKVFTWVCSPVPWIWVCLTMYWWLIYFYTEGTYYVQDNRHYARHWGRRSNKVCSSLPWSLWSRGEILILCFALRTLVQWERTQKGHATREHATFPVDLSHLVPQTEQNSLLYRSELEPHLSLTRHELTGFSSDADMWGHIFHFLSPRLTHLYSAPFSIVVGDKEDAI